MLRGISHPDVVKHPFRFAAAAGLEAGPEVERDVSLATRGDEQEVRSR